MILVGKPIQIPQYTFYSIGKKRYTVYMYFYWVISLSSIQYTTN